jgi:hypothetical protein
VEAAARRLPERALLGSVSLVKKLADQGTESLVTADDLGEEAAADDPLILFGKPPERGHNGWRQPVGAEFAERRNTRGS